MGDLEHEHGRQWEAICFYNRPGHKFISRIPDVINCPRTGNDLHPTQKPVELIRKIISANEGSVIFDPFMGSGTTGVAAIQCGRKFIGIEQNTEYFEIAKKRIMEAQGMQEGDLFAPR